ncbi:MAG TPA: hypothetical protein DEV96_16295, partial [Rhodospirillum rubrum]|nr:hypothetical protein [Rhodospirillum rubrum]
AEPAPVPGASRFGKGAETPPRPAAAPSAPVFDAAPPRLGKQDGLPLEMDPEPPSRIPAHDDAALDE